MASAPPFYWAATAQLDGHAATAQLTVRSLGHGDETVVGSRAHYATGGKKEVPEKTEAFNMPGDETVVGSRPHYATNDKKDVRKQTPQWVFLHIFAQSFRTSSRAPSSTFAHPALSGFSACSRHGRRRARRARVAVAPRLVASV